MEGFFQKLWDDIFSPWNLENILRGGGADSLEKCNYTVLEKSFDSVLLMLARCKHVDRRKEEDSFLFSSVGTPWLPRDRSQVKEGYKQTTKED